ncbi:hypothetical protein A8B78_00470 [Jannaschia sp. EhC01]|nr:hypothetical protein A8B78_00470 [Jannaschia sp. EhC01]
MIDHQTISVYGAAVERYRATPMSPDHVDFLDAFATKVCDGGLVLDLGCGPGDQAKRLMDHGLRVDAIDATPAFVEAAVALGVPARRALFEDLPGATQYDGIWASFSLLHAPRDAVQSHILRLAQSLTPGGVFFLGMKTGDGEARDNLGRFYSYFSVDALQGMLTDAGLTVTDSVTGRGKGLAGSDDSYALMIATADA